jgi:hypothetical protein
MVLRGNARGATFRYPVNPTQEHGNEPEIIPPPEHENSYEINETPETVNVVAPQFCSTSPRSR